MQRPFRLPPVLQRIGADTFGTDSKYFFWNFQGFPKNSHNFGMDLFRLLSSKILEYILSNRFELDNFLIV